jgi:hypothetical protein
MRVWTGLRRFGPGGGGSNFGKSIDLRHNLIETYRAVAIEAEQWLARGWEG